MSIVLASCSTATPAIQGMNYLTPEEYASASDTENKSCDVLLNKISDKRHSKKSFGTSSMYEQFAIYVPEWVEGSLLNMEQHKLHRSMQSSNDFSGNLSIDIDILKAYVHHSSTVLNATVVLRVIFNTKKLVNKTKIYRGTNTSTNWSSSTEQIEEVMNTAISKIITTLSIDISDRCQF